MQTLLTRAFLAVAMLAFGTQLFAQPEYNLVYPLYGQIADCDGSLSFDPAIGIPVGESEVFVFTIRNDGDEPLLVTTPIGMEREEAFFVIEQPDTIIAPGTTSEFSVAFTPPCPGRYRDRFTVFTNDPDEPACTFTLDHIGLGEGPILIVFDFNLGRMIYPDPTGAEFGPLEVGSAESHLLWLTNVGTEPVKITQWSIPAPFFGPPQEGTILAPMSKTSSSLQYFQNECGVAVEDMLKVSSTSIHPDCYPAGSSLESIRLRGTTEACETGDPDIELSGNGVPRRCGSTVYFFGNNVQTITIENQGTATLDLTGVSLSNNQYELLSEPAMSIAPGGSTSFQVAVSPGCSGLCSAKLYIQSNDPDEGNCRLNLLGIYSSRRSGGEPGVGERSIKISHPPATLFPNPVGAATNLAISPADSPRNYQLIDAHGRQIGTGVIPSEATLHTLEVDRLPAGLYFLRIEGEDRALRLLKK